jgi:preprotein translocase subunit SecB
MIQSAVEFHGYKVLKTLFTRSNVNFESGTQIDLRPAFSRRIIQHDAEKYSIVLGVRVGSQEEQDAPIFAEVLLEGDFALKNVDDAETVMKVNAVAIMFPYLRATLSMLTMLMNIDPIVLPTVNLVQMFEDESKNSSKED